MLLFYLKVGESLLLKWYISFSLVNDWQTNTKQKMKHYFENTDERLGDEEVQKLGKKDVKEYPFVIWECCFVLIFYFQFSFCHKTRLICKTQ